MVKHYTIAGLRLLAKEYAETCNEYPDEIYVSEKDEALWVTEDFFKWLEEREDG